MTGGGGSAPVDLDQLEAIVAPLIHQAGEIALGGFRTSMLTANKGGKASYDPVTDADRATETYLRRELSALFPEAEIVGEEGGTTGSSGRMRWVIDPIDGTKAYVSGIPLWGVLLGLVVDRRAVAGWCRQPYLDETFAAVAGSGWLEHGSERRNLETRSTTELSTATMYTTHPSMFTAPWERAAFDALAGKVRMQRYGGDCYLYCMLALGHVDLIIEASMQSYDIVPLIPIVDAAGGVVTNADGEPPLEGGFIIAAATPQLHRRALAEVAAARESQFQKEDQKEELA